MPYNGSGTYTPLPSPDFPAVPSMTIRSSAYNNQINDMAAALSSALLKDGRGKATADIDLDTNKLLKVGAPSATDQALRRAQIEKGADIASASGITIPVEGSVFTVTGTTTITAINTTFAGRLVYLQFAAALTLTHGTDLVLPSGVSVTTLAGDVAAFICIDGTKWVCVAYPRFVSADYPSATEPTITWPYMPWADTGNMLLKRRNTANAAWVVERGLLDNASAQNVLSLNGGQLAGMRNKIINGNFEVNQRNKSAGSSALSAGAYGHDRWKAGASGCTYSYLTFQNVTTITITAGSLLQIIEGSNLQTGTHTISWGGTAQGRWNGGAYGSSGMVVSAIGGTNGTIEFGPGTVSKVQVEPGPVKTPFEFRMNERELCAWYCQLAGAQLSGIGGLGGVAGARWDAACPLSHPMRADPTVTILASTINIRANGSSAPVAMTLAGHGMLASGGYVVLDRVSATYVGNAWILSETPDFLLLSAEL